jgi:NAD(P)H dehydrogenase (quinone)
MHALIVTAHPEPRSLTHSIAAKIGAGLTGAGHTFEIADLAAEGFDPRFTPGDLAVHRHKAARPADVAAEQARIDRTDALVLVYPVYWWSMPGLMKGWIDRVFSNQWAFDFTLQDGGMVKKLQHLKVHLVQVAGADAGTYERHGYFEAMRTQIDHGIFDFCGATVASTQFMLESEGRDATVFPERAEMIGTMLFEGVRV